MSINASEQGAEKTVLQVFPVEANSIWLFQQHSALQGPHRSCFLYNVLTIPTYKYLVKAPVKHWNTYDAKKLPQLSVYPHVPVNSDIKVLQVHLSLSADLWVCCSCTGVFYHLVFLYNIKQLEFPTTV